MTVRDSTFGRQEASSATYYGQSILTLMSRVTLENVALNNESSEVIAFNSGGEYETTSACSAGWYGSCSAIGEVYSCELDVCIPCPGIVSRLNQHGPPNISLPMATGLTLPPSTCFSDPKSKSKFETVRARAWCLYASILWCPPQQNLSSILIHLQTNNL